MISVEMVLFLQLIDFHLVTIQTFSHLFGRRRLPVGYACVGFVWRSNEISA
jgi:hypothetical protein